VAHPEGRRASAKLRAFVQCLRDAFGTPPDWEALITAGSLSAP
jgi:hypothetical protein